MHHVGSHRGGHWHHESEPVGDRVTQVHYFREPNFIASASLAESLESSEPEASSTETSSGSSSDSSLGALVCVSGNLMRSMGVSPHAMLSFERIFGAHEDGRQ